MPMVYGYSARADDYIELEWIEDADWDQAAWDEWNRMEALHERDMKRRLSPAATTPGVSDMMTSNEITAITQAIERLLLNYELHLGTDQYNRLHDHIEDLVRRIHEGE